MMTIRAVLPIPLFLSSEALSAAADSEAEAVLVAVTTDAALVVCERTTVEVRAAADEELVEAVDVTTAGGVDVHVVVKGAAEDKVDVVVTATADEISVEVELGATDSVEVDEGTADEVVLGTGELAMDELVEEDEEADSEDTAEDTVDDEAEELMADDAIDEAEVVSFPPSVVPSDAGLVTAPSSNWRAMPATDER